MNEKLAPKAPDAAPPGAVFVLEFDASLAGAAYQAGEQSGYIAYAAAKALDRNGRGSVPLESLLLALSEMFSTRQARRVLATRNRYFTVDGDEVLLNGVKAVVASLPSDMRWTRASRRFEASDLTTSSRRGAALVAAALAGVDAPRSNQFLARSIGVDRKTISAWSKDSVIQQRILRKMPTSSDVGGRRRSLPNRWLSPAPSGRGSVRMQAALRSRLMRKPEGLTGTEGLRRIYFRTAKEMYQELTRLRKEVGVDGLCRALNHVGAVQLLTGDSYQQFDSPAVLAFLGIERTDHHTTYAKREESDLPAIAEVVGRSVTGRKEPELGRKSNLKADVRGGRAR